MEDEKKQYSVQYFKDGSPENTYFIHIAEAISDVRGKLSSTCREDDKPQHIAITDKGEESFETGATRFDPAKQIITVVRGDINSIPDELRADGSGIRELTLDGLEQEKIAEYFNDIYAIIERLKEILSKLAEQKQCDINSLSTDNVTLEDVAGIINEAEMIKINTKLASCEGLTEGHLKYILSQKNADTSRIEAAQKIRNDDFENIKQLHALAKFLVRLTQFGKYRSPEPTSLTSFKGQIKFLIISTELLIFLYKYNNDRLHKKHYESAI